MASSEKTRVTVFLLFILAFIIFAILYRPPNAASQGFNRAGTSVSQDAR